MFSLLTARFRSGGSQELSNSMTTFINKKPLVENPIKLGRTVRAIRAGGTERRFGKDRAKRVVVEFKEKESKEIKTATYDHVISTLPLPTMRTLDLGDARLDFDQKLALRTLQYGPSIKIGIKFKSNWWKTWKDIDGIPLDIEGGQSYTDRPIRTVVYPSYGLDTNTNVLIASYCWTSDAEGLSALINPMKEFDSDDAEARLKELVLK